MKKSFMSLCIWLTEPILSIYSLLCWCLACFTDFSLIKGLQLHLRYACGGCILLVISNSSSGSIGAKIGMAIDLPLNSQCPPQLKEMLLNASFLVRSQVLILPFSPCILGHAIILAAKFTTSPRHENSFRDPYVPTTPEKTSPVAIPQLIQVLSIFCKAFFMLKAVRIALVVSS